MTFSPQRRVLSALAATTLAASLCVGAADAQVTNGPIGTLDPQTQGSVYGAGQQSYNSVEGSWRSIAATGSLGAVAGSSIPNDVNGFYSSIPAEVEGEPGQILKSQRGTLAFGIPGLDLSAGNTHTLAYVSRNSNGKPTPVTGTVITNQIPWTGPGQRPTLVIAPGTQGTNDQCAPSRLMHTGYLYETVPVVAALAKGWNVALTDLNGLGTPAIQHTYMNRVDQGQATLDMARAAINSGLGGINKDTPLAVFGYSQGGGASASALELAPTYAPELQLRAGYAGGVPADLSEVVNGIDSRALAGAMGYAIQGFLHSDPEIRPVFEEKLNQYGIDKGNMTGNECIWDSLARHAFADSKNMTKDGRSIKELLGEEPIKSVLDKQRIGKIPPQVPVYVGQGTNDDTIPAGQARTMARNWCEAGAKVYYQEHNIPKIAPLVDHAVPMVSNLHPAVNWLDQVFRGQAYPTSSCSDIPS